MSIRPKLFPVLLLLAVSLFGAVPLHPAAEVAPEGATSPAPDAVALIAMPEGTAGERAAKGERLFWEAMRVLNKGPVRNYTEGRVLLMRAASLGDLHAQFEHARYVFAGMYGFKASQEEGARLFLGAAEDGLGYAMVAIGQCYLDGTGVKADTAKAERWLEAALADSAVYSRPTPPGAGEEPLPETGVAGAVWSDPVVATKAGARYLLGRVAEKRRKPAEAHAHFTAAAYAGTDGRDGIIEAARQAALDHAFGTGTPRDLAKAREWIAHGRTLSKRQATFQVQAMVQGKMIDEFAAAYGEEMLAKTGDALFDLFELEIGRRLADRKSKESNPAAAAQWFRHLAEQGKVWHMIELALLLGGKDLGKPDPAEAFLWWERAGGGDEPLSTFATANLAICLQNGLGTPRDTAKAAELFKRHRNTEILCYLGTIGAAPKTPQAFDSTGKLFDRWARKKKDPQARYLLGMDYMKGTDDQRNVAFAIASFKQAAEANHPDALYMLGTIAESLLASPGAARTMNMESAYRYYWRASELGSPDGALSAGLCLQRGMGGARQNPDRAMECYERCLKLRPGEAAAHNNMGVVHETRLRDAKEAGSKDTGVHLEAMLREFETADRLGYTVAALNLGRIHRMGELVPREFDKAYALLSRAAEQGIAEAHYQLGQMHELGESVPVTLMEAAYQYRHAALQGHMQALRRLVDFYITGKGVARDLAMAEFWLNYAREERRDFSVFPELAEVKKLQGDHAAAFDLYKKMSSWTDRHFSGCGFQGMSQCYKEGLGVQADATLAQGYLDLAIEKENPDALATLAQSQLSGGKKSEGVETMTRAAQGSGAASYWLGQMYYFGTNVEQDRVKSMHLMRDSARMRFPKAMYFLAAATYNRDPEAPELDEAILFASMAENMGVQEAPELREKLERRRDRTEDETELIARPRSG